MNNELIRIWLKNLYKRELKETEEAISNERLWEKGSETEEEVTSHMTNIANLEEYRDVLKRKIREVDRVAA